MKLTKSNVLKVMAAHNALSLAGGCVGKTVVFSNFAQVVVVLSPEYVREQWQGGRGDYPDQLHVVVSRHLYRPKDVAKIIKEWK